MRIDHEQKIISGCKQGKAKWQKALFDQTVDVMRAVCARYTNSSDEIDDILQEGYIKIFDKIESFELKAEGMLGHWMKRIFVNVAIDFYRKQSLMRNREELDENTSDEYDNDSGFLDTDFEKENISVKAIYDSQLTQSELIVAVSRLPQPLRLTFNLFAIEGMKHKDIAELLNIPIKTSTTRVLRAKQHLQEIISEICAEKITSIA